jgi:hypothetical protein
MVLELAKPFPQMVREHRALCKSRGLDISEDLLWMSQTTQGMVKVRCLSWLAGIPATV